MDILAEKGQKKYNKLGINEIWRYTLSIIFCIHIIRARMNIKIQILWTKKFVIYTSFSLRKGVTCHILSYFDSSKWMSSSLLRKWFSNPAVSSDRAFGLNTLFCVWCWLGRIYVSDADHLDRIFWLCDVDFTPFCLWWWIDHMCVCVMLAWAHCVCMCVCDNRLTTYVCDVGLTAFCVCVMLTWPDFVCDVGLTLFVCNAGLTAFCVWWWIDHMCGCV